MDSLPLAQIRRLARLLGVLDYQRNQLFMPFAFLWLWTIQLALPIDAWRSRSGRRVGHWLKAVGEFESLCALASYAAENRADPFPEIVEGPARFTAEAIGHPLTAAGGLRSQRCCARRRGAGVDRERLEHVGQEHLVAHRGNQRGPRPCRSAGSSRAASTHAGRGGGDLRIQDSLQAGRSRFYAEITRVRQMVDLARGPLPLLFLFDELFNGTNSHDRCVGAEGVVRGLIELGASAS